MVREGDNSKNRQIKPPSFGVHRNTSSITLLQKVQKDYYLVIANEIVTFTHHMNEITVVQSLV
jgi:hypothetical protein